MSARKRFLKNGLAATLQKVVRIFDQLLLVPFFITAWGVEFYGEWLTLMIVPTILGFSDMGFGTAAANSYVLWYASGSIKKSSDIFISGLFAISIVVAIGISLAILFVSFADGIDIINASIIPKNDSVVAVAAMMLAKVFSFYQQLFEARFNAARKYHISIYANTGYSTINLMASVYILSAGYGIVAFSYVSLIVSILYTALYAFIAIKILPFDKSHAGVITGVDLREIFKKGFSYLMSPIWQAIFFQGTTLVVRIALGPSAVTVFNTVRSVTRVVNQFYTMVISASLSELQFEIGRNNYIKARKIFRVGLFIIILMATFGIFMLLVFGKDLYEIWTRNALNPPSLMWSILIVGIIFNALWWPASFIFQAMNKPRDFAVFGIMGSLLSVITSYFLTMKYGLSGAAAGSLVLDLFLCIFILPRGCKLISQSVFLLPKNILSDLKSIKSSI